MAFLDLPSELLCLVFEAQHSVLDVLLLSSTCRKLRHSWLTHFRQITEVILSREMICYEDAVLLAKAQADFDPSLYEENIATCCAALQLLNSPQEIENTHEKTGQKSEVERKASKNVIHEIENTLAKYEECKDMLCDEGCITAYDLRLRHLRRLYFNARQAESIAHMCLESDLVSARYPSTYRGPRPEIDCPFHPKEIALPHERERAYQCFYFLRLLTLGSLSAPIAEQDTSALENMPLVKLYAIYHLHGFLAGGFYGVEEPGKTLGICVPRSQQFSGATEAEVTATARCTPEWGWAHDQIYRVYRRRRAEDEDNFNYRFFGMCDRCNAGGLGVQELCEDNGAEKNLWNWD